MVNMLLEVDENLANIVADKLGLTPHKLRQPITDSIRADGNPDEFHSFKVELPIDKAPSVSQEHRKPDHIKARRIAILTANGINDEAFTEIKKQLCEQDAVVNIIALKHGFVKTLNGDEYPVCERYDTTASVVFDAVYVPGGESVSELMTIPEALHFVAEAYKHCKPIGADKEGVNLLKTALPEDKIPSNGVITSGNLEEFVNAIKQHRFWEREENPVVSA